MSTALMKTVRDRLVNDSSLRTLLGATATGSATVFPLFSERSGVYAQVIYTQTDGRTDPGLSATNGLFTFNVEVQSQGLNPHITYSNIQQRIEQLLDDQIMTGTDISGTAAYVCLMLKEGSIPVFFNPDRKVWSKLLNFSYRALNL